ncbi:HsdM family class I SAM-dependent methyltransferase [Nocardioides caldifontis]|uniref:HsdM family class I SAM-dependent methyltransferase n=1 Tax=Nocardioides caldifontis TaxID=2588938 RepID=UPI0019395D46|nr:N-6 DNA methylase [Nocardioides caldifontis]
MNRSARAATRPTTRLAGALAAGAERLTGPLDGDRGLALRATYRVLHAVLARRAGALAGPEDALEGFDPTVPAQVSGEVFDLLDAAAPDPEPTGTAWLLSRVHQELLAADPTGRKRSGSWFTPPALVAHLLDETLEPALDEAPDPGRVTVLDPACGSGIFLVEAARRIAARSTGALAAAVTQVHGTDLDDAAVELARVCLWLLLVEPGHPAPRPELRLRVDDALLGAQPDGVHDVVVGNPPFLNRLERRTAPDAATVRLLGDRGEGSIGPYTDVSAVFLHRAVRWVRPGGRIGLVQPQSLLAARDAAGVRRALAAGCALESVWASDRPVFEGTPVLTCAPVLRTATPQGPVRRAHGPSFGPVAPREVAAGELDGEWSFLLAAGLGVPEVVLRTTSGTVGTMASCTADFRDQYYGLAGSVHEQADLPGGVPLVTAGLVEPAACLWGSRTTRFLKQRWTAPVVDVDALPPALAGWAAARLVPKVLVATQGPVVEAVADPGGRWLPSVPVVTVAADPEQLWHLLAVLLAPPVSAHAAARYAGTALTMRAVKLSARQVAALPLPSDRGAWDEGAALARAAQDDPGRPAGERLRPLGAAMCAAYGLSTVEQGEVLDWWCGRLR